MARVDIIQIIGMAYQKTWGERRYLLPMLVVPLLIKYFFFTIGDIAVEDDNLLRFSLIMIPGTFAEGWLLAHWVRTIVVGHRWPFRPTGDDAADIKQLKLRGRGVLSGAVAFTLINMLMAGYFSFFMRYIPMELNPDEPDPTVALMGVFMMIATVMFFRYIWFYVPLSVNTQPKLFLKAVQPISVTFKLLGIWLVFVVPAVFLLQIIGSVLGMDIGDGSGTEKNILLDNLFNIIRLFVDMAKNLVCTAGMTFAIMQLLGLRKT
jgi:hypothetical protein